MSDTQRILLIASIPIVILIIAASLLLVIPDPSETATLQVDFSRKTGNIDMYYGANEAANWMEFASMQEIQQLHKDVGSKYIRVWIDDPAYRSNSTIPYENGIYNFEKLDSIIDATLKADAIPFVVFAHAPKELSKSYTQQVNGNPPKNHFEFATYCATIVQHYKDFCKTRACNIEEWYWEIWNEPYWDHWWEDDEYIKVYNKAYSAIKEISSDTKVGGYTQKVLTKKDKERTQRFLTGINGLDFISLHIYGNYPISSLKDKVYIENLESKEVKRKYEQEMLDNNEFLFLDQIILLKDFMGRYSKNKKAEIIVSELGPNWNWRYEPYLDEPFVAAWYASALHWMIRTELITKEFFYSGTTDLHDGGFAMWSIGQEDSPIIPYPVYHMKKEFIRYNTKGSTIYRAESKDEDIEILAVSNSNGKYITIINKRNLQKEDIVIKIQNYPAITKRLSLNPYEVRFLKIL